MDRNSAVGVFDSGIGGFTLVRELQKILPGEDIIYFGDCVNMPYGSRSPEDILHLTRQICQFMRTKGVKAAAAACNTISTVLNRCRAEFDFPLFSIIESGTAAAAAEPENCIGLIGTPATVQSDAYAKLIGAVRPEMTLYSAACPRLSVLIESGRTSPESIDGEIRAGIDALLRRGPVRKVVLACTHYPLVIDRIRELYPALELIDPAQRLALDVRGYLAQNQLLADRQSGSVELYTTGSAEQYLSYAAQYGIAHVICAHTAAAPRPLNNQ